MSSFDPLAVAIDWLDAYRAKALSIVELYADSAALECACSGAKELYGRAAISEYWRQRFIEKPAGELTDIRPDGDSVVVSYRVPDGVEQAILRFDDEGRIRRSVCGPAVANVVQLRC
jgi:hypothetical protein